MEQLKSVDWEENHSTESDFVYWTAEAQEWMTEQFIPSYEFFLPYEVKAESLDLRL